MPESPSWLLGMERIEECEQAMRTIARFNGKEDQFTWDRQLYTKKVENKNLFILEITNLPKSANQKTFNFYLESTIGGDAFANLILPLLVDQKTALVFCRD
jgi:hypothetical protein